MRGGLWGIMCLAIGAFFAFGLWNGFQTGQLRLRRRAVDRAAMPVWFGIVAACYALAAIVGVVAGVSFLRAAQG